jgi:hypothetical protein
MKKMISIVGTCAGGLSVILSFYMLSLDTGSYENAVQYGGDAYTGIQNAAAQTAVNVYYLNSIMKYGFFGVLLVAGIALLCHYLPMLIAEKDSAPKPVKAENAPEHNTAESEAVTEVEVAGADELKGYKDLLDSGILTEEEYAEKAREIMGFKQDNSGSTGANDN